jgi:hypothetical protein
LWNYKIKSIVAEGFLDNNDNVQISTKNCNNQYKLQSKISVSEYLREKMHLTNGVLMFDYVYQKVLGKNKFIVPTENFGDVTSYISVIIGELACDMKSTDIRSEFNRMAVAARSCLLPKWEHLIGPN